jgi:FtsH-binding integral membrane protein
MADNFNRGAWGVGRGAVLEQTVVDEALRSYMLRVYNMMASGLLLSGIVAVLVAMSPSALLAINTSGLGFVVRLAPLGLILWMSFGINRMSAGTLQALYWVFVATFGLSLSSIFMVYRLGSIGEVFFITAGTFGAMSLYGYTTKRDLTGFGSFLMMGLFGIIIAMVVNWFVQSAMVSYVISVIGVLIFTGLTAYDTQKIKAQFYEGDGAEITSKKAVMGAINLYLDFVNLFLFMLRLFGDRR